MSEPVNGDAGAEQGSTPTLTLTLTPEPSGPPSSAPTDAGDPPGSVFYAQI